MLPVAPTPHRVAYFQTVLYIQQYTDGRYTMGLTEGVIGIMT